MQLNFYAMSLRGPAVFWTIEKMMRRFSVDLLESRHVAVEESFVRYDISTTMVEEIQSICQWWADPRLQVYQIGVEYTTSACALGFDRSSI